jgi:hypothetical protein
VLAGHERYRHAGLERLLDQPDLLRHRPAPAALHRGDHLDAPDLFRHSRMPRLTPRPSRYATCPVETGAAPSTIVGTWRPGRLELYVDGFSRAPVRPPPQTPAPCSASIAGAGASRRRRTSTATSRSSPASRPGTWCGGGTPIRSASCAHGTRCLHSGECATRHAPRDRHWRGHLPAGVAPSVSASCCLLSCGRAPRPGLGARARDPDHDSGLQGSEGPARRSPAHAARR